MQECVYTYDSAAYSESWSYMGASMRWERPRQSGKFLDESAASFRCHH